MSDKPESIRAVTPKQAVLRAWPKAEWIFFSNVKCWHIVADHTDRYSPLLSTPGILFRSARAAWADAARRIRWQSYYCCAAPSI